MKGDQGEEGLDGPLGPQGVKGPPGADGSRGKEGTKGINGQQGRKGNQGQVGPNGDPGTPGMSGRPGAAGHPGPPGEISGLSGAFARFFTAGGLGVKGPPGGYNQYQQYRYYKTEASEKLHNAVSKHYANFKTYFDVLKTFDAIVSGKGTKKDPAITCKELFKWHPTKPSGDYWVDPNEGSTVDAILVYCDKKVMETCVYPKINKVDNEGWPKDKDEYKWAMEDILAEKEGIPYAMDMPQMKMLQLQSDMVRQTITYNCKNSFAVNSMKTSPYEHPLKFLLYTDEELLATKNTNRKLKINVITDECWEKSGEWKKAVIELSSHQPRHLPLSDIAAHDIGGANEEFEMKIGPVCFS